MDNGGTGASPWEIATPLSVKSTENIDKNKVIFNY